MSWKERKGIVVALLVAVVGVWGYAGYMLVDTLGGTGDEEAVVSAQPPARSAASGSDRLEFIYSGAFRDPFAPPSVGAPPAARSAVASHEQHPPGLDHAPEPDPPRVRLLGFVDGTATVETASGGIHFVRQGDEVEGARVTAVGEAEITLRKDGRSYDVPLQ